MLTTNETAIAEVTRPIDALLSHAQQSQLVILSDGALFAIDARCLSAICTAGGMLAFDDPQLCRPLATGIEGGLRFSEDGRRLYFIRGGVLEQIELNDGTNARLAALPRLPGTLIDVVGNGSMNCLCVTRDDADRDLSRFGVRAVGTGALAGPPIVTTSVQPLVYWSPAAGSFLVFDPCAERASRVAPRSRLPQPVDFTRAGGRAVAELICHPTERSVVARLTDPADGSTHLLYGWHADDGIRWDSRSRLPDGLIQHVCYRPNSRELYYVRQLRRRTLLERLDPRGNLASSLDLPRELNINSLACPPDGNEVYLASSRNIAVTVTRDAESRES